MFRIFAESKKKKKCSCSSSLRLSFFLMSESAFLLYCEFNTTTWITVPPVFNCPNEQGFNCHPWDYCQSFLLPNPLRHHSVCVLESGRATLVMFGKQSDVPCPPVSQQLNMLVMDWFNWNQKVSIQHTVEHNLILALQGVISPFASFLYFKYKYSQKYAKLI